MRKLQTLGALHDPANSPRTYGWGAQLTTTFGTAAAKSNAAACV